MQNESLKRNYLSSRLIIIQYLYSSKKVQTELWMEELEKTGNERTKMQRILKDATHKLNVLTIQQLPFYPLNLIQMLTNNQQYTIKYKLFSL